jgi:broad specificity phosphatase PhoE
MDNNKDKYLKYKTKYLNLKKQIGSGNTVTSLIVTHNGKIRCLLDKLGFSDNLNYNTKKLKFKNCVILKLEITSNQMSINMIDQGDLSKEDNYDTSLYFTSFDKVLNYGIKEVGSEPQGTAVNNKFIFYLIRHGDGTHNKAKQLGSKERILDPLLTKVGEAQCLEAGKKLGNLQVNFLFVSELIRTRQSLYKILQGGIKFSPLDQKYNKVIVLPCSHEINYKSENCDIDQDQTLENEMKCDPISDPINNCPQIKIENSNYCKFLPLIKNTDSKNLCIDWSHYNKFHGDLFIRRSSNCKDTHMIIQAIKIILS